MDANAKLSAIIRLCAGYQLNVLYELLERDGLDVDCLADVAALQRVIEYNTEPHPLDVAQARFKHQLWCLAVLIKRVYYPGYRRSRVDTEAITDQIIQVDAALARLTEEKNRGF